ncbi:trypsin-like [Gopherus flavomarginatus]|uniref:trypsin-like n=1 Tax=Gopherus flavomarginatus TaxID=286002 RepID=UPI0021CBA191|nr:trypsin-like [Gopherus flavomarginatus]
MKLLGLVLLLVTGATVQDIPRMLRGFQCQEHSHPWIVALFDGVRFRCTGTLIDRQWVVTAARCNTGRTLNVRLGEHNLWHLDWSEQLIISSRLIPHPLYNRSTSQNNIMLVKLLAPAILNRDVKPLPLPRNCPRPDSTCVLSGWGSSVFQKAQQSPDQPLCTRQLLHSDILLCGNITVLADAQCQHSHPNRITPNMICAGVVHGGTDSCQGDPGSPLVCQRELQGIASWGFEGCSRPNQTGVFVKVCNYLTWLQDTMRSG